MTIPIGVLLAQRARLNPGATAFTVHASGSMTFDDWYERANAVAGGLASRGVRPGDRIAIFFSDEDWLTACVAYVAVQLSGGVVVPLRRPLGTDALRSLIDRLAVTGLVSHGDLDRPVPLRWSASVAELADGSPLGDGMPLPVGTDPAAIVLTSGTTRDPKAVVCTHASLTDGWDGVLGPPPDGSVLTSLAVGSNAAQATLCSSILNGVHTVLSQRFEPGTFRRLARVHEVTCVSLVPTRARALVQPAPDVEALTSVRTVISSSAPLDQATVTGLASLFPNAEILNVYTLTEGGPSLVALCDPDTAPTLGRVDGGDLVRVVDEKGREVPPGEPGELWIRSGTGPRRHYLHDPAQDSTSRTRFLPDGWIGTGDLCYQDGDGVVHFVGRADDVIISGSANVAAAAVEDVLRRHPAVRDVAVFGAPDTVLGESVVAVVVLAEPVRLGELRDLCAAWLRPHEQPHHLGVLPELPTTPTGKVLKRELLAAYGHSREPDGDEAERMVAEAFERVLAVPSVDRGGNFFDLGGHSLRAAQVAAELTDRSGAPVPVPWVLRLPVVRDLAARLAKRR